MASAITVASADPHLHPARSALLYTALEFLLTHSLWDESLRDFLDCTTHPLDACTDYVERAQYIVLLIAAITTIVPSHEISAAFENPLLPEKVINLQVNLTREEPSFCDDTGRPMFRSMDFLTLELMRQESRQLCLRKSGYGHIVAKHVYLDEKNFHKYSHPGKCLYVLSNGTAKLAAIERCLNLVVRLCKLAFDDNEGDVRAHRGIGKAAFVRRHLKTLNFTELLPSESTLSGLLRGMFETEKMRLLAIQAAREAIPRKGTYLWPRWGNPRPNPSSKSSTTLALPQDPGTAKLVGGSPLGRKKTLQRRKSIESGNLRRRGACNGTKIPESDTRARKIHAPDTPSLSVACDIPVSVIAKQERPSNTIIASREISNHGRTLGNKRTESPALGKLEDPGRSDFENHCPGTDKTTHSGFEAHWQKEADDGLRGSTAGMNRTESKKPETFCSDSPSTLLPNIPYIVADDDWDPFGFDSHEGAW